MRNILKWLGYTAGLLLVVVMAAFAVAWIKSENGLQRRYAVSDPPLAMRRDAQALARGAHLFATRGCADCHGADAAGRFVLDGGPVIKLIAPNITPGGVVKAYNADHIAASIRHGVKASGHAMVFMPSAEYTGMGDDDTAALVAYLQSLPASNNNPGLLEIRPLGRVMYAFGDFPLLAAEHIDHRPRARVAPPVAASAEYGAYVAQGCIGCHGNDFAGQHVPGTPPSFPNSRNLTPTGLGTWTAADFRRALREGKRPNGSAIDPFMPWQAYSKMTDVEIDAIWAFLQTLPPAPTKKR